MAHHGKNCVRNVRVRHFISTSKFHEWNVISLALLFMFKLFLSPPFGNSNPNLTQTKLVFYENHLIIKLHTALETERKLRCLLLSEWQVFNWKIANHTNAETFKMEWKKKIMLTITTINEQSMWSRLLS